MKDTLFLLKGGFDDEGQPWFCPSCAKVEGMLSYFPQLREVVDVHYVDFQRPREQIAQFLGEHQGAPVLILRDGDAPGSKQANGHRFIDEPEDIWEALAARHGVPRPHA